MADLKQLCVAFLGFTSVVLGAIKSSDVESKIKRELGSLKPVAAVPAHHALVEYLLDPRRYNPTIRPVRRFNVSVQQRMRMNLYQILDVDEPHQQIVLYAWTTQYWPDYMLGWDPADFEGMGRIIIPWDKVWIPDTVLYNCVEMTRASSERWISVIYDTDLDYLNRTGESRALATFQYPAIYKFSCKMNIFLFPFDDQNCTMTFGSWVYDAAGIEYTPYRLNVTFEDYVENEEWRVVEFYWKKNVIKYACCEHPFTLLDVVLIIQRKSLYYVANLVLPTGIITFIAIVGFFTPASTSGERTEKMNLGITTLLAMSILLLMVNENMPTTSNFIPLMGWFFLLIIVMISVGAITTALIIVIHQQHIYGRRVPRLLKAVFFGAIAPLVLCKPSAELKERIKEEKVAKKARKGHKIKKLKLGGLEASEESVRLDANGRAPSPNRFHKTWAHLQDQYVPTTGGAGVGGGRRGKAFDFEGPDGAAAEAGEDVGGAALGLLVDIQTSLDEVQERLGRSPAEGAPGGLCELEWAYLATILDRLCLLFFVGCCSTLTLGMIFLPTFFGNRTE